MKKTTTFLLIAALLLLLVSCGSSPDVYEGGKLYKKAGGKIYVAELTGTFRQMGRQYGLLLGPQIRQFYKEAVEDLMIGQLGWNYEDMRAAALRDYAEYPKIFKDYLDAAAETNGLGPDKTYILAGALTLIYSTGCSSLSAWGDYTTDRSLIVGRNLDLPGSNFERFGNYYNVIVFNPTGYPASVAQIDLIGGMFYQTAMNSKGIFLDLQNGQMPDTSTVDDREDTNNILFESLFRNTTSDETDLWFKSTLTKWGLIMNASFPDHASIYEWSTFRVVRRDGTGLLSASNDYIDPSWHDPAWAGRINFFNAANEGGSFTYTRRTNLLSQGEQNKGSITPQKMMEIFDTTIPEGGATFPGNGAAKTIYSVVAQPGQLKLWLKIRGTSDWEEIDLKNHFH